MLPLALSACSKDTKPSSTNSPAQPDVAANPATASGPSAAPQAPQGAVAGKVAETMDSGGYTYALIDTGSRKVWAAGPASPLAVGDQVSVAGGTPMRDFSSQTLNRTFAEIYFVSAFRKDGAGDAAAMPGAAPPGTSAPGAMQAMPAGHGAMPAPPGASAPGAMQAMPAGHGAMPAPPAGHGAQPTAAAAATAPRVTGVKPAEGGYSVAALYEKGKDLAGQEVVVRGQVVKFNGGIMGKNWLHIQDGTGAAPSNDLVVTSAGSAKVGDVVVVRGKLAADKDLGHGYKYAVIIEDATVTTE